MNRCIVNLFNDEHKIEALCLERLPIAFEIVSNEIPPRNPAIGMTSRTRHYWIFHFCAWKRQSECSNTRQRTWF